MRWVVPSGSNADVRELLADECKSFYKVVLVLGGTAESAEVQRQQVGGNVVLHAREINALFRAFQGHRKFRQFDSLWSVVFYPGNTHPVSKAYNRLLKDPSVRVVVVSTRRGVVRDDRLTVYNPGYVDVDTSLQATPPSYWVSSWLF